MSKGKKSLTSKFGAPSSGVAAIRQHKSIAQGKQGPFGITKKVGKKTKTPKY